MVPIATMVSRMPRLIFPCSCFDLTLCGRHYAANISINLAAPFATDRFEDGGNCAIYPRKSRRFRTEHPDYCHRGFDGSELLYAIGMAPTPRPRRSALYLPGNKDRALEKAKSLPADVLIFDLEDAVGPDAKAESRARVCSAVASAGYRPREVVVRINGAGTDWHDDDLTAVAASAADAVLVPKVETGHEVEALANTLDRLGAPRSLQLWAMIETPRAILRAEEIASASERLTVLVVGTNDLVNDLHGRHVPGRAPVAPALSWAVLGARAAGKSILTVFTTRSTTRRGSGPRLRRVAKWALMARP